MKWLLRLVLALILLLVVAAGGGYLWLRTTLPQTEGTVTLAGLAAPVEVVRDRHGVPHIYAKTRADAAYALGFVHAQDRLWQMEMERRIGQGRLSELFGETTVATDRFLRTMGFYHYAERTLANLDPETQAALRAYAAGVNAYLDTTSWPRAPEFLILRHRPEPWRPADSLVWTKMMSFNLAGNWANEVLRIRLARRLTPRQIAEAFPGYPADAPVALSGLAKALRELPLDWVQAAMPFRRQPGTGSNNWVLAGDRTATGKPLLANDPHLGLDAPSVWYFAHLEYGDTGVIGATLPGVPSVVLGRNRRLAWGFTNTYADVQDMFIEQLDPADDGRYLTPDGSLPFETRHEVIKVKDSDDIVLTVRTSRHGPIISDASASAAKAVRPGYVLAFGWPILAADELTAQAGWRMNEARDWTEFRAALRDFHAAPQNVVYADVDGNIGFQVAGRTPLRAPENAISGMMPVPGWQAEYDWQGWIPFDELPRAFNPKAGFIATANNRIVGDDYPYYLTFEWQPPYRIRRILDLLGERETHSIESFKAMQADVRSEMVRDFLPLLLAVPPADESAAATIAGMAGWDGTMAADSVLPTIFSAWYRELTRLVYADEMGGVFDSYWNFRPIFLFNVLTDKDGQGRWCDDTATAARETCETLIRVALTRALADLETRFGDDREDWQWGRVHQAVSDHNPFTRIAGLREIFDIRVSKGGGRFTVNVAGNRIYDDDQPFRTTHGPSLRAIYDLDDPDRSLFIHSTGQSGNRLSPNYASFAEPWAVGDYIPMTMRRAEIEAGAMGRLVLRPAP